MNNLDLFGLKRVSVYCSLDECYTVYEIFDSRAFYYNKCGKMKFAKRISSYEHSSKIRFVDVSVCDRMIRCFIGCEILNRISQFTRSKRDAFVYCIDSPILNLLYERNSISVTGASEEGFVWAVKYDMYYESQRPVMYLKCDDILDYLLEKTCERMV